jgi:hypothetical protein
MKKIVQMVLTASLVISVNSYADVPYSDPHMSVNIPKNWTITQTTPTHPYLATLLVSSVIIQGAQLRILKNPRPSTNTIQQWKEHFAKFNNDTKNKKIFEIKWGNTPWAVTEYEHVNPQQNPEITWIGMGVPSEKALFTVELDCPVSQKGDCRKGLDTIMNTFQAK